MRVGQNETNICNGDWVRIRGSMYSPYSGRDGTVVAVDPKDLKGVYLVRFEDGMHFRYWASEIQLISEPASVAS